MTAIVDYGVGNLFSLYSSLRFLGMDSKPTADPAEIRAADRIILPGVGAFGDAALKLRARGMDELLKEQATSGKPLLGICLGMQLLFERSFEHGEYPGLGLLAGEVCPIAPDLREPLKVPQIGWNSLEFCRDSPICKYTVPGSYMYYVHSYYVKRCETSLVATSEYGVRVAGIVQRDNVFGTQFHPEKSGKAGLGLLKAFAEIKS